MSMDVAFVLPSFNNSGGVKLVTQIANGLHRRGHRVTLYAPLFPRVGRLSFPQRLTWVKPECRTKCYISEGQIGEHDILIATGWETYDTVARMGKKYPMHIAYFVQHIETWDYYNTGKLSDADRQALATYNTGIPIIYTSDWIQSHLEGRTTYKVPAGIEIPHWCGKPYNAIPRVSALERGIPWKGDKHILKLKERGLVNTYKNLNNKQLSDMLWRTDIFVSLSEVEGFNLPVLEAMAHGCCCISTDVGAVPEYGRNTVYIVKNPDKAEPAIWTCLNDIATARKMGRAARKEAERWSIENTVGEFECVLYRILRT